MPNATSAPVSAHPSARPSPHDGQWVLFHETVCPQCGSDNITEEEVDTGDGITEVALICHDCGTAWPVACIVDWDNRPGTGRP